MSTKKASAEIYEFEDARSRLRADEIDPGEFVSTGAYLEAARLKAGISVDTVAERTHIKPRFIEAIESMDLDALPARPFAIGFLKSYAEALELEAEPIIERFKQEIGAPTESAEHAAEEAQAPMPSATGGEATLGERPHLTLLAVVAILAFVCWCAFWITRPRSESTPVDLSGVQTVAAPTASGPALRAEPRPGAFDPDAIPPAPAFQEARLEERIEPVYPPACEAIAQPVETVEAAFTIRVDGAVVSERIVNTTNPCFNRSALNAVRQWRFAPRLKDGRPVPAFDQRAVFTFARPD